MNKEFYEVRLSVEKEISVAIQEVRDNELECLAAMLRAKVFGMLRAYECIPGWSAEFTYNVTKALQADKEREFAA